VKIEVLGDPLWTATCHCADCRRATGAASSAFAGYEVAKCQISGARYTEYESSPGVYRGHCGACAARLTFRGAKWLDQIHFHIGAFDDPDAFAPRANVNVREKLSWVQLEDGLPALATTSADEAS